MFGEKLIQKSSPLDAVLIEDELEELHSYCQEVFSRVARFHHRLVNTRPVRLARMQSGILDSKVFFFLTFNISPSGRSRRVRFLWQRPGYGHGGAVRCMGERRRHGVGPALVWPHPPSFTRTVRQGDSGQRGLDTAGVGPHGGRGRVFITRGRRRGHVLQCTLGYSDLLVSSTVICVQNDINKTNIRLKITTMQKKTTSWILLQWSDVLQCLCDWIKSVLHLCYRCRGYWELRVLY